MHGYLGRGNRRVIPACVVTHIRCLYRDEANLYVGFRPATQEPDEEAGYIPADELAAIYEGTEI
jgi:hypothetical protein